jgi:hypothetical protein
VLNQNAICVTVTAIAILFSAALGNRAQAAFSHGDFTTHIQADWGAVPDGTNAASLLQNPHPFAVVYPTGLIVGIVGVPGAFWIVLTSGPATLTFLPRAGSPEALTSSYVDPIFTNSGLFGGELAGLHLNIDFSDAGILPGNLGIPFGDLVLANLIDPPGLNGMSVRDFTALADGAIAGALTAYSAADLTILAAQLNESFWDSEFGPQGPSAWAQEHLRVFVDMRGDFNQNGTVDAADYVVWRKTLGQTRDRFGPSLAADANDDGQIDAADYGIWRSHFGNTALTAAGATAGSSSSANAAVPEPTAAALALLALLGLACRRNRGRNQC